ncbi:hypothetical protein COB64_02050 [Candidatus Wolfebacteria bacterium]|nr:MAG: hypothetical protein COB64_02050 [Candidatus Wolfebacteria bacterium]
MKLSSKEITEKFSKLPDDVRSAVLDASVGEKILSIGKKHTLTVSDIGKLVYESNLIILGLSHPKDFAKNLKRTLSLSSTQVDQIVNDINTQVFEKIRSALKHLHGEPEVPQKKPEIDITDEDIERLLEEDFPSTTPSHLPSKDIGVLKKTGIDIVATETQEDITLQKNIPTIDTKDEKILESSGVKIQSKKNSYVPLPQQTTVPLQQDLKKEIPTHTEEPLLATPKESIVEKKLKEPFTLKRETHDYSDTGPTQDPYRERIQE